LRRCGAAESDFGTIHLIDLGITAGSALAGGNSGPRQEAEFHETAGIVDGKVDVLQNGVVAFAQVSQRSALASGGGHGVLATELQFTD
jgi:hypothetical protein